MNVKSKPFTHLPNCYVPRAAVQHNFSIQKPKRERVPLLFSVSLISLALSPLCVSRGSDGPEEGNDSSTSASNSTESRSPYKTQHRKKIDVFGPREDLLNYPCVVYVYVYVSAWVSVCVCIGWPMLDRLLRIAPCPLSLSFIRYHPLPLTFSISSFHRSRWYNRLSLCCR
ncbi:hypothetical protein BC939DRAFT_155031 [Gamsiella multidivaricata]|uniref:uncharacterized protein n=1 Tax=Gamsiella multidivaricata TaxID=101098 RepID=UPI00221F54E5|nr:uncharacterized protein BC939DRAFT_155031 [Gamsiella multidivaricata]KAI7823774.1 hypothetical protein BC939DRAFT_155031 [Gamsiella multidivaricata]